MDCGIGPLGLVGSWEIPIIYMKQKNQNTKITIGKSSSFMQFDVEWSIVFHPLQTSILFLIWSTMCIPSKAMVLRHLTCSSFIITYTFVKLCGSPLTGAPLSDEKLCKTRKCNMIGVVNSSLRIDPAHPQV